jgi:lipopolysaccharide export system protein LptA
MFQSLTGVVIAQDSTVIHIVSNDKLFTDPDFDKEALLFTGDVVFRQDSTWFYCDSAQLFDETNTLNAFGKVRIMMKDSTEIFGDSLNYLGNDRIAYIYGDVMMVDDQGTLFTDTLIYNRNTKVGYYLTDGKIVDSSNILTSRKGYYYSELDQFYFRKNVHLDNPDYVMDSDTMLYNTKTEIVTILGPTTIVSDSNTIRGTSGWYDTKLDVSQFDERASLDNGKQILFGDSLYYDRNIDYGEAVQNVVLYDRENELFGIGNYGEYWKPEKYAFLTDSAVSIMIEDKDSLFMHADTIHIQFDENDDAEIMRCYNKTKFFRHDLQGMCDSLRYVFADSMITMLDKPVLWSEGNQLTGDTIKILIQNESISRLYLVENSFIISHDSIDNYNQMKGKNTTAYFMDNELNSALVEGSSESIYFMRDEDTGDLQGIWVSKSGSIRIMIEDGELDKVTYIKDVDAPTYPDKELPAAKRKLDGFEWLQEHRPEKKEDIFIWNLN